MMRPIGTSRRMSKLTCQQAEHLFNAYLDGELSAALATELDAHRLSCPACRQGLALMEVTGHVIRADREPVVLADDFTERLLACVQAPPATPVWRRRYALWIGGTGLAAAAAIALSFTLFSGPQRRVAGAFVPGDELATITAPSGAPAQSLRNSAVDAPWAQVRDSTASLADFGKLSIMQILDRLGFERVEPRDKLNADDSTETGKKPGFGRSSSDDVGNTDDL